MSPVLRVLQATLTEAISGGSADVSFISDTVDTRVLLGIYPSSPLPQKIVPALSRLLFALQQLDRKEHGIFTLVSYQSNHGRECWRLCFSDHPKATLLRELELLCQTFAEEEEKRDQP